MNEPPHTPRKEPERGDALFRLEHFQHWWREPLAGLISVGIGSYDVWKFGRDGGFTSSLDEILILTGIALVAGVRNLFGNAPTPPGSLGGRHEER